MNEQRQVTVQLKGVKRSTPAGGGDDGGCGHIVNMRFKDGAWRLAGEKVLSRVIESAQAAEVLNCSNLLYHETYFDGVIGSDNTTGDVIFFNFEDENKATLVDIDYAGGERVTDIRKFGKMLIIASNKDRYIFKWDDETNFYTLLPDIPEGQTAFWDDVRLPHKTDGVFDWETLDIVGNVDSDAIISSIKKKLWDDGVDGYFEGHVFFRTAWRLFDNSLVHHSSVHYMHVGLFDYPLYVRNSTSTGAASGVKYFQTNNPILQITFTPDDIEKLTKYKGIIRNLVIFMSAPVSLYDLTEDVNNWTDTGLVSNGLPVVVPLIKEDVLQSLFEETRAMYNVKEYDLEDVLKWTELTSGGNVRKEDSIIVENIHSIETRETISTDNFTHHRLSGSFLYDYNSRLHIGDTLTRFGLPINNARFHFTNNLSADISFQNKRDMVFIGDIYTGTFSTGTLFIEVDLETEDGSKLIRKEVDSNDLNSYGIMLYSITTGFGTSIYAGFKEIITYPDIRARNISLYISTLGVHRIIENLSMKEHPVFNLAYFQNQNLNMTGNATLKMWIADVGFGGISSVLRSEKNTLRDTNRVQASELGNVFVYPAKNSYRIGQKSNTVVALATMSSPMGEGQFGQFPLHVFTDAGIYNLNQGSGEVLYGSIHRFNLDVLDAKDMLMELGGAVVYVSRGAVYMLAGSNRTRISQPLESKQDVEESDDYFGFPSGSACRDAIAPITWDSFLSGMKMAYNHNENELVLSNATAGISYVYQFATGAWFATDEAFKIFVMQANGGWIGITASGSMYDLTEEDETTNYSSHVCFVTRPMLLGNRGLKKISRTIGRMIFDVVSGSSVMMGVYGSLNARDWTLLRSVTFDNGVNGLSLNDVMIKDTHSSAKYFIISFRATVGNDFEFTGLDMSVEDRFNRKLR